MMINLAAKSTVALASVSLYLQQLTPVPTDLLASAERLTLVGALVIAVAVLWRTNAKQAEQMVKANKEHTDAMSAAQARHTEIITNLIEKTTAALVVFIDRDREMRIRGEHR